MGQIFYKYRTFGSEHAEKLFSDNTIYFASAQQLNDPFEFAPFIEEFKSIQERRDFAKKMMKSYMSNNSVFVKHKDREKQVNEFVRDLGNPGTLQEMARATMSDVIGVYSMTTDPLNLLMWSYYAESHTGFCVGYDFSQMPEDVYKVVHKVAYQEKRPGFSLVDWNTDDQARSIDIYKKIAMTKSKAWEHEKEYRFVLARSEGGTGIRKLKPRTIKSVIAGARISEKNLEKLSHWVEKYQPFAELKNAVLQRESYALELEDI